MSLLLAAASVLATLVTAVAPIITVLGFAWALTASLVIDGALKREARRAAAIQEAFDTGLYQMSWNTAFVGQPVPPEDLHRLVRAFHRGIAVRSASATGTPTPPACIDPTTSSSASKPTSPGTHGCGGVTPSSSLPPSSSGASSASSSPSRWG